MNKKIKYLLGIAVIRLLFSFTLSVRKDKKQVKNPDQMLCVGACWTEAEGKAFLEAQRKTYTTEEAWEKRAKQIRKQILKGAGLEKYPKKCPLNPIIGEKRIYDGYQV